MSARLYSFDGHARIDTKRDAISDSDLDSGWPTTRKFARSAHGIDAAWRDGEYATPIERYESEGRLARWLDTAGWIAAPLLVIAVCAWVWFKAGGGQ